MPWYALWVGGPADFAKDTSSVLSLVGEVIRGHYSLRFPIFPARMTLFHEKMTGFFERMPVFASD
jgi:hypothetical protein